MDGRALVATQPRQERQPGARRSAANDERGAGRIVPEVGLPGGAANEASSSHDEGARSRDPSAHGRSVARVGSTRAVPSPRRAAAVAMELPEITGFAGLPVGTLARLANGLVLTILRAADDRP